MYTNGQKNSLTHTYFKTQRRENSKTIQLLARNKTKQNKNGNDFLRPKQNKKKKVDCKIADKSKKKSVHENKPFSTLAAWHYASLTIMFWPLELEAKINYYRS